MASEGSAEQPFFIYDHTILQKEDDDLNDAIIYYYPPMTSIDDRCALCGQLMGMVTFFVNLAGAAPSTYRLRTTKVVVRHSGQYTLALGGDHLLPDRVLLAQLDFVHRLFRFYHRDFEDVAKICKKQDQNFVDYLGIIWDTYIPFARYYGDDFLSAMRPVPTLHLARGQSHLFLRAVHLLEACQRAPGVLSGCLLVHNRVVCTQLTPELTSRLLLLRPHQSHLPCRAINTEFTLPVGVRLLAVYITEDEESSLYPPWADHDTGPPDPDTPSADIPPPTKEHTQDLKSVNESTEDDRPVSSGPSEENLSFVSVDGKSPMSSSEQLHADLEGSDVQFDKGDGKRKSIDCGVDQGVEEETDVKNRCIERQEIQEIRGKGPSQVDDANNEGSNSMQMSDISEMDNNALSISRTIFEEAIVSSGKSQRISVTCEKQDGSENIAKEDNDVCDNLDLTETCQTSQLQVQHPPPPHDKGSDTCDIANFADVISHDILIDVLNTVGVSNETKSICANDKVFDTVEGRIDTSTTRDGTEGVNFESERISVAGESAFSQHDAIKNNVLVESQESMNKKEKQNISTSTCDGTVTSTKEDSDKDTSQPSDTLLNVHTQSQEGEVDTCKLVDQLDEHVKKSTSLELVQDIECSLDSTSQPTVVAEGSGDKPQGILQNDKINDVISENKYSQGLTLDISGINNDKPATRPNMPQFKLQMRDISKRSQPRSPTSPSKDTLPLTPLQPASKVALFKAVKEASKMAVKTSGVMTPGETSPEGSPFHGQSRSSSQTGPTPESPHRVASPVDSAMKKLIHLTKPIVIAQQKTGVGKGHTRHSPKVSPIGESLPGSEQVKKSEGSSGERAARHKKVPVKTNVGPQPVKKARLRGRGQFPRGADGLQEVDLYIQGNADLLLLVVMEPGSSQNKDTVQSLWQMALPQLGEMDLHTKQRPVKGSSSKKKELEYNYLTYNSCQQSLSGNMIQSVTANENKFCETTIKMHEDFSRSETLSDIVLRSHNSYVYGHRAAGQETYFQQHGSARTLAGFPNERQLSMAADNVAYQKMFSEEKSLII